MGSLRGWVPTARPQRPGQEAEAPARPVFSLQRPGGTGLGFSAFCPRLPAPPWDRRCRGLQKWGTLGRCLLRHLGRGILLRPDFFPLGWEATQRVSGKSGPSLHLVHTGVRSPLTFVV